MEGLEVLTDVGGPFEVVLAVFLRAVAEGPIFLLTWRASESGRENVMPQVQAPGSFALECWPHVISQQKKGEWIQEDEGCGLSARSGGGTQR